jgi:hypothetical protein
LFFFARLARDFFPVLICLGLLGEAARAGAVAGDPMNVVPKHHSLSAIANRYTLLIALLYCLNILKM